MIRLYIFGAIYVYLYGVITTYRVLRRFYFQNKYKWTRAVRLLAIVASLFSWPGLLLWYWRRLQQSEYFDKPAKW